MPQTKETRPSTSGVAADNVDSMRIQGEKFSGSLKAAITEVSLERRIDSASTLILELRDPDHRLVRSPLFTQRSILNLDDQPFQLVGVRKQGGGLSITFEAAGIAELRRNKGKLKSAARTTTRTEFARRLVEETRWLNFHGDPGVENKKAIIRGGKDNPDENSWDCLKRLAAERSWRVFESEGTVFFGSDDWLLDFFRTYSIGYGDDGILEVDFEKDTGKRAERATIQCLAQRWALAPGRPIVVEGLGSLMEGKWLVESIRRSSLWLPETEVVLVRRTKELPEPKGSGAGRDPQAMDYPEYEPGTPQVIKGGGLTRVGRVIEGFGFIVREHRDFGGVTGSCNCDPHCGEWHCKYGGTGAIDVNWTGSEGHGWERTGQEFDTESEALSWLARWIKKNVGGVAELYWWENDPEGHPTHLHVAVQLGGGLIDHKATRAARAVGDPPEAPNMTVDEVMRRIRASWPGSFQDKERAVAVAKCESSFRTNAYNEYTSGGQVYHVRGVFQISDIHRGTYYDATDELSLYSAPFNIEVAKAIFRDKGWGPWTCAQKLGYTA